MAGPFDNKDMVGLAKKYLPETTKNYPDFRRAFNEESFGYVDLNSIFTPNDFVVAYALGYLYSPDARKVQFRVGSDDGMVMWLNNEEVFRRGRRRSAITDDDIIEVNLKEGWNKITIKVDDIWGDWGFYFRITNKKGWPVSDLLFSPQPQDSKVKIQVMRVKHEYEIKKKTISVLYILASIIFVIGIVLLLINIRNYIVFNRMKSEFTSNLLHEINTPLTSIRLAAETLKKKLAKDNLRFQDYCHMIIEDSHRLESFVRNLSDFSLLKKGRRRFPREKVDIDNFLNKTINFIKTQELANDRKIILNVDSKLPQVLLNESTMTQAMVNLIINALKYSSQDKVVHIEAYQEGKRIVIDVIDEGIGIPKKDLKYIFNKFYRAKNTQNIDLKGSGVGLFIAKSFVQAHGGRIIVESKVKHGSVFSVILPLR